MEETRPQPYESLAHRHQHTVEGVVTLLDWLLVAFILALLFQGFAMQAFQIPTGSMAETLRGAHYHLRCLRCGHAFDVGSDLMEFGRPWCGNCDYYQPPYAAGDLKNGDRIFVLKSIYQFYEPKRWDVVVFKNPTNPRDNYIKRLIGLPNETVQLIRGDVFIDGKIARKPANVQNELWIPIFLRDYQPLAAADLSNNSAGQEQNTPDGPSAMPFQNEQDSGWELKDAVFSLHDASGRRHTLSYVSANPHDFQAMCSYNDSSDNFGKPVVSDLMINFFARPGGTEGYIGASLEKYGVLYSARVEFGGSLVLTRTVNGVTTDLRLPMLIGRAEQGRFEKFEFACVDQLLVLRWGQKRLAYDLSGDAGFARQESSDEKPPRVQIFAAGPAQIRHVGLFRDIFYMGKEGYSLRATDETPFTLKDDQFFVCGDNSNNSLDGRLWPTKGIGNNGQTYDEGVVPRDYMMGKAVMVYWSQAFRPLPNFPPMIPNWGTIKVIYGGGEREY
ncbi:MAG: signal peptidase I [Planctomycetales bacterium]|nr:signal peptidase I [Planctomycetales bacterium]